MHSIRTTFFLLIIFTIQPAVAQWSWLNPLPEGNEYFDGTFVSATSAWLVGGNGAVLHSPDGGAKWSPQANALVSTPFICLSAVFLDAQSGMISANNGSLLRTSDGGIVWQLVPSPSGNIQKLRKAPDGSIWGFGSNGIIARTSDLGTSWREFNTGINTVVFDVTFPDASSAVASCGDGTFLRTADNGQTWSATTLPVKTDIVSVAFTSATKGFAVQKSSFLLRTVDGGATWKDSTVGLNLVRVIRFTDPNTGWLISNSRGTVLKTTNGGDTWNQVSIDSTYRYTFQNIVVKSEQEFYLIGEGGGVFETKDGGLHWTQLGSGATRAHVHSVSALGNAEAWVFGEKTALYTSNRGTQWSANNAPDTTSIYNGYALSATRLVVGGYEGQMLLSTDAGANWTVPQILSGKGRINQILFLDQMNGWVAGNHGTVARTVDGGATWINTDPGVTDDFNGIAAVSINEAWVVGNGGKIFHTGNGGLTWTQQATTTQANLHAVQFTSATDGWAGGQLSLMKTNNGGQTWTALPLPGLDVVYRIRFTDAQHGFFLLSRAMVRTSDGGATFYRTDYPSTGLNDFDVHSSGSIWLVGDFGTVQNYNPAAAIQLAPSPIDFGDVRVTKDKYKDVTITNTGEVDMSISNISVLGKPFTFISSSGNVLQPGQSATASMRFAPTDTGIARGVVTVQSNAALGLSYTDLVGNGIPLGNSALIHSPSELDFGKVRLGTFGSLPVQIQNRSQSNILVNAQRISGNDSTMFQVEKECLYFFTPSAIDTARILFGPTAMGKFTSTFLIDSRDPVEPLYRIPIKGEAVNPIIQLPDTLYFNLVTLNIPKVLNLRIENRGTAGLLTANYRLTGNDTTNFTYVQPPQTKIAPGWFVDVPVHCTTTTEGLKSATLHIESDDVLHPGVSVLLLANGTTLDVEQFSGLPAELALHQNYPNPASSGNDRITTFQFDLPTMTRAKLAVYDALGRRIALLADGLYGMGSYHATFDIATLPSGLYVAELVARASNGQTQTLRIKTIVTK